MGRQTCFFATNISFAVFLSFLVCLCSSRDTITFNQPLKDGDLLISTDNSYAIGFFTPGNSTGKRYVGLWYKKIPEQVVVWVANRDNPVKGKSGILFIDTTGNLVIQDTKTNVSVWNTSIPSYPATGIKSYSAQLQETGNLVLYHDRVSKWQSFDYPTNTLLASMKLGVGRNKSLNWFLKSWKSRDDPGTGEYTVGIDLTGKPQAFLYKNSTPVWRLGPWNGIRWSGVPQMTPDITPYAFTENQDEFSEEYWIQDPNLVYTIVMLNESGTVNKIIWKGDGDKKWFGAWYYPNDDCDRYGHCGAFGICGQGGFSCRCVSGFEPRKSNQGCWRNETGVCNNGEGFLKLENMKIPDTEMARVNTTIGLEECEEICLENCSCTAYASANISDGGIGCITWYGELIDMREFTNGGQDIYVRVSASDLAQHVKKSKWLHGKWLIVTVVVAVAAAMILLLLCLTILKGRKGKKPLSSSRLQTYEEPAEMGKFVDEAGSKDVLTFDLNTIRAATDNFSADNKLGEGGFGSVYKGKLQNGELIAVKRLTRTSLQGIVEFKNEVTLIAKLQHRNLVRLLGCCIQQGEKMLVYEYLPNKSLDSFIFDNAQAMSLDWRKRFEIISGIAEGLLYLHQDSRLRIIHRDLKASNVLLDASMQPKISDFGMARIFGEEQVEANTNRVVGTYGYMSPEYAMEGIFSVKSDVFSFGILILEIVSGKKNKYKHNENSMNLIGDVWDLWSKERALEIVDPALGESYNSQEVLRCIHVGLLCVQPYTDDRQTMSEVIFMLSNDTKLPRPNAPGFTFDQGNTTTPFSYSTTDGNQSINSMSITAMGGR